MRPGIARRAAVGDAPEASPAERLTGRLKALLPALRYPPSMIAAPVSASPDHHSPASVPLRLGSGPLVRGAPRTGHGDRDPEGADIQVEATTPERPPAAGVDAEPHRSRRLAMARNGTVVVFRGAPWARPGRRRRRDDNPVRIEITIRRDRDTFRQPRTWRLTSACSRTAHACSGSRGSRRRRAFRSSGRCGHHVCRCLRRRSCRSSRTGLSRSGSEASASAVDTSPWWRDAFLTAAHRPVVVARASKISARGRLVSRSPPVPRFGHRDGEGAPPLLDSGVVLASSE